MAELPTGTVTFMFTDIEGSTELLSSLGDAYPRTLERHNEIVREAVQLHAGQEVATEGDAFFVVFRDPAEAVRAALAVQRALAAEPWLDGRDVRVRIGLHTGQGVTGAGNYVGLDVHRASRIATAGHGGQVLLSDATRALVEPSLPEGAGLRDLGRHRLKGLATPEQIYQLSGDDLRPEFPPLASLEARPNNLPAALTSFVGREKQVVEVADRLAANRLVTMTGPGGTGKTRLSIRVAEEVLRDFEDGCWFVPLDALRDPALVPATIAAALNVRVPPDRPAMAALEAWLAERRLLLVLDNFEQITGAATEVASLLAAAPGLRVLVTSRTPLHVYGETEYPVPPLASASELRWVGGASPERLSEYEAVKLFIDRAVAVKPDFSVTNENAPAVAEICARLDGLPLAIELAAARVKLLTPEQMLARLEQNLSLLSSAARDRPERQRTLRGAIDWSHDLLTEPERRLFAWLSVFRGGFTLEAAEHVAGAASLGTDVLDGISALVDNSLLRTADEASQTRFGMLETIREYARERLVESGEADVAMHRHGSYYLDLARRAGPDLMGPQQVTWTERLRADHDNLRAAFARAPETGLVDEAMIAAGAIWRFWLLRGELAEGRAIFERLLERPSSDPVARASALTGAGGICYWQGDYEAMSRYYVESRQIHETSGDRRALAEALYNESFVPMLRDDLQGVRPILERSIRLHRETGNELGAIEADLFLALTYYMEVDPRAALASIERAISTYRAAGAQWYLADTLVGAAYALASLGEWPRVLSALREALSIFRGLSNESGVSMVLEATAAMAAWVGDAERTALLLGKRDDIKERVGGGAPAQMFRGTGALVDGARAHLGEATFARLRSEGTQLTTAQASDLVEAFDPPADAPPLPPPRRRNTD